ncbi:hypothetical protein Dimus_034473 [Dionaea muscipula]
MAEQHFTDGASSSEATGTSVRTTVELNIKTLDSRIFTFHVEKSIPVLSFKEKIAGEIGVPVGRQRLIFRGKVLKDEHLLLDYHVENGDTLHLVERQPIQPQSSSGTNSGETTVNSSGHGDDGGSGPPRNRIGQISHSVVLGTFNVGDQGDGGVPDVNRVIGAVLNSLGIGNLATSNSGVGAQNATPPPQGSETGATHNAGSQIHTGSQTQSGQPQAFQFPVAGASVALPSFRTPIPDSLHTITEFINRMEWVLSQNGNQPNQSSSEPVDQLAVELPSNARGLPTAEALSIVLRRTQQLIIGGVATMLSHITGHLEQEAGSTDPSVRSQIQTESVQLGLVMQHLGALFLELGRTILTLRMGLSPVESAINAGPAVYISSSGPNPIMVQPFPLQTSPLFNTTGTSPAMGTIGPIGIIGSAPRHVNIHIHAGTSLAPIGSIAGTQSGLADGTRAETSGVNVSGDAGPQGFPLRNVVPGAVPARPVGAVLPPISVAVQPILGVSAMLPSDSASLSSVFSEVNTRLRNLAGNAPVENQTVSVSATQNSAPGLTGRSDATIDRSSNVPADSSVGRNESHVAPPAQEDEPDSQQNNADVLRSSSVPFSQVEASASCLAEEVGDKSGKSILDAAMPAVNGDHDPDRPSDVPLGLGLGGLQPKKRRQVKPQPKNDGGTTSTIQSQPAGMGADQVLQLLASVGSADNRTDANTTVAGQPPSGITQLLAGMPSGCQSSDGQLDFQGMMSQFVQSPAFNGLLAGMPSGCQSSDGQLDFQGMMSQLFQSPAFNGIFSALAARTGGSVDDLRNGLHSFTQNPNAMNTVSQIAQELRSDDLQPMVSRLFQQMMPIVSQALGRNSGDDEMMLNPGTTESLNVSGRTRTEDRSFDQSSQVDIRLAVQQFMQRSSPQDVFRAVVQNAARLYLNGEDHEELVNDLCSDDDLANEFMEILHRDLRNRLQGGSSTHGNPR